MNFPQDCNLRSRFARKGEGGRNRAFRWRTRYLCTRWLIDRVHLLGGAGGRGRNFLLSVNVWLIVLRVGLWLVYLADTLVMVGIGATVAE